MRRNIYLMTMLVSALVVASLLLYWDKTLTIAIISLSEYLPPKAVPLINRVISRAAHWTITLFFLIWGTLYFRKFEGRKIGLNLLYAVLAAGLGYAISQLIQSVWDKPRPFVVLGISPLTAHKPDPAFPSDYAVVCYAFATALTALNRRAGGVGFAVATAVSLARVYSRLHWVADVFLGGLAVGVGAGIALATFWGWLACRISALRWWLPRNQQDTPTTSSETP